MGTIQKSANTNELNSYQDIIYQIKWLLHLPHPVTRR